MSLTITLPIKAISRPFIVDWGDGNKETFTIAGEVTHTYAVAGTYEVKISGGVTEYGDNISQSELIECQSFGLLELTSLEDAFRNAENLTVVPSEIPDSVTNLANCLNGATSLNQDLSDWNLNPAGVDLTGTLSDSGLSEENYSRTLIGWANQVDANSAPYNVSLGANNLTYNNTVYGGTPFNTAENAHNALTSAPENWTITGDTLVAPMILEFDTSLGALDNIIEIYLLSLTGNVTVDWGDTNIEVFNTTGMKSHTYASTGTYQVQISGSLTGYGSSVAIINDQLKLTKCLSFGALPLTSLQRAFNLSSINEVPVVLPATVTSLDRLFLNAQVFNHSNITLWDVSNVTNMNFVFRQAFTFNQDIGNWDVSSVDRMQSMFHDAQVFNQDIGNWDVSNVTNMSFMFEDADTFNQDLGDWDVSNVTDFESVFCNALAFNQDLSDWNLNPAGVDLTNGLSGSDLSEENYSRTLIGWANQVDANSGPYNVSLGSTGLQYTNKVYSGVPYDNAYDARVALVSAPENWTITGDTLSVEFPDWDGIDASDFSQFQTAFNLFPVTPSADTVATFGSLIGTGKWIGGVLAPNGFIYCIPRDETQILKINPATNITTVIGSLPVGTGKWTNGVLAENGCIYALPRNETTVLKIDTATDTITTFGSIAGSAKYSGGVLAPNNCIYGVPEDETNVLKIDTATDTITTFGVVAAGANKFQGASLAPNGSIYAIPHNSTNILKIDTATDTLSTFGSLSGTAKWIGGVLAENGCIYAIPYNSTTVLKIDPDADTTSTFGSLTGTLKWYGGVISAENRIYGIPFNSTTILKIDPDADTTSTFGSLTGTQKWRSGVLAPNGFIYGVPRDRTDILTINTSNPVDEDLPLSRFYNKL